MLAGENHPSRWFFLYIPRIRYTVEDMNKNKYIDGMDIARGLAEVTLETVRRAGAGVVHLATERFQNATPSEHHFEHPVTDRPATYTFPRGSEGEYYGEMPEITPTDLLPPEAA